MFQRLIGLRFRAQLVPESMDLGMSRVTCDLRGHVLFLDVCRPLAPSLLVLGLWRQLIVLLHRISGTGHVQPG